MFKGIVACVFSLFMLINMSGCLLFAGAAGGAGTAVWLSGKLTQEVNAPYDRAIEAAKSGLKSLGLVIKKETKETNITQLRSVYTDGREIWVDVRKITETSSKIEVRVGAVSGNKEAAEKILNRITRYL